jgi:hypothetical protein
VERWIGAPAVNDRPKRKVKRTFSGSSRAVNPVDNAASLESENHIFAVSGMYSIQAIGKRESPREHRSRVWRYNTSASAAAVGRNIFQVVHTQWNSSDHGFFSPGSALGKSGWMQEGCIRYLRAFIRVA